MGRTIWIFGLLVLFGGGPALAQDDPNESLFKKLFPNPSGLNGYEEIVAAGELTKKLTSLGEASSPQATLSLKRQVLRDASAQEALRLVKQGLQKPLKSPRDEMGNPALNLMGSVRQLGRLLTIEQYVLMADGHGGAAIDSLRTELLLSYAIQTDLIIGALVGVAINSMALKQFEGFYEGLSVPDCDQLQKLAIDWILAPNPMIRSMQSEMEFSISMLRPMGQEAVQLATVQFESLMNWLRRPNYQPFKAPEIPNTPAGKMVEQMISPVFSSVVPVSTQERASIHKLGIHAAIRKFRWEHQRLPATLVELKLPESLSTDPANGKPFAYKKVDEKSYTLVSAGDRPKQ